MYHTALPSLKKYCRCWKHCICHQLLFFYCELTSWGWPSLRHLLQFTFTQVCASVNAGLGKLFGWESQMWFLESQIITSRYSVHFIYFQNIYKYNKSLNYFAKCKNETADNSGAKNKASGHFLFVLQGTYGSGLRHHEWVCAQSKLRTASAASLWTVGDTLDFYQRFSVIIYF